MASTPPKPAPARYHGVAILLHWLLAGLLVYQFALGLRLDAVTGTDKFAAFQLHKSIGITILLLSLARLALRLTLRHPAEFGQGAQKLAAQVVHWAFYGIMVFAPLSGWISVSTAKLKVPTLLFGALPWPHLPLLPAFNQPAVLAHTVLTWSLPALIALHVAAVIYHLRKRDEVPGRMFPAATSVVAGVIGGVAWLGLTAALGLSGPLPDLWSHKASPIAEPPKLPNPLPYPTPAMPSPNAEPAPTETAPGAEVAVSCDWTVQPGSRLGFVAHYGSDPVGGTFRKWQARIKFCADDLPHASIAATVNLASAATGDADRDENLRGASFFDTAQFAQARFSASGFKLLEPGRYAASGKLSLHGVDRPVRIVFTLVQRGAAATAQGSTSLSRLAFGVGSDEWAATDQIPDAVAVQFTIRAVRAN